MKNWAWSPPTLLNFGRTGNVYEETAAREVTQCGDGLGLHIPDQQLQTFRRERRRKLQEEMADQADLQVDKAEPAD